MGSIKQHRTAEKIKLILSDLFHRELRDPRLHSLTVTEVRIDRELQYADIYVHALGEDARQDDVMSGLASATGYLRRQLAQRLQRRTVPRLHFHWDPTLAHAARINALLDDLVIPPALEEEE